MSSRASDISSTSGSSAGSTVPLEPPMLIWLKTSLMSMPEPSPAAAAEELEEHDDDDADDPAARGDASATHGPAILEVVAETAVAVAELDHAKGYAPSGPRLLRYSARRASTARCRAAARPGGTDRAAAARHATRATTSSASGDVFAVGSHPDLLGDQLPGHPSQRDAERDAARPARWRRASMTAAVSARSTSRATKPTRPHDSQVVPPTAHAGGECVADGREGEEAEEQPEHPWQELHALQVGDVRRR